MKRSLLTLATILLFLPIVTAQPPATAPAPPQLVVVESVLPGQETVTFYLVELVHQKQLIPVTETVVVNGQQIQVTKIAEQTATVPVFIKKTWSAKDAKANDVAGNVLTKEVLFERLKAGDAVLWLPAGQKLHPMYQ